MRSKHLNRVAKFARILNLRFLDFLPCTCKMPGQDHFGRLIFIYEPIFNFFVALFTTFGMKKDDNIILYVNVLEQGDMQKGGFQRMV